MSTVPPPLPPQPLDYRGDLNAPFAPRRVSKSIFSITRFIAALIVMAIIAAILLLIIPRFETIYKDFDTRLPAITVAMLNVSRVLRTPVGQALGTMIALVIAGTFAVLPVKGRWLRLLIVLILALIVIALALAVLMPMISLMESISANPGKL